MEDKKPSLIFRLIDRFNILKKLVRKGGITLKWAILISAVILIIVSGLSLIFTVISTNTIMDANDDLTRTIINNISSSEAILTAEKKPFKRSLVLQDMVSSISKSDLKGLVHVAIYDLNGKLNRRRRTYAAHTIGTRRGKWYKRSTYKEIKGISDFKKERIIISIKKEKVPVYRYRMPFKFFDTNVGVIEIIFSEESILAPIKQSRLYIIIAGGLLLFIGMIITIVTTRRMVTPIKALSDSMLKVRKGDLDLKLDINRHDEIGDLKDDFQSMVNHLREKIQMQKFVSNSTISMIKETSAKGEVKVGGKKKTFAFLFSDVRGFTAMSENLKPEEVVTVLNKYLDLQAKIIKKNKGDIDKFVGDEVMAFFSGRNKIDNAIKASIELIKEIKELNDKRTEAGERIIEVGVGLHVGDVVHGRMGSEDRMDNTSIGDTVNLAARLCSQAEAGIILASKDMMESATNGKFEGEKLEPIKVKGKAKPIEIYSVTGMADKKKS